MEENKMVNMDDESRKQLLREVKKAAGEGARSARLSGMLIQILPVLLAIGALAYYIVPKINAVQAGIANITARESIAQDHDLVVEDHGIFGYTAADFEDAILGSSERKKEIEVFTQEVSDASTVTNAGFMNWAVFSKNQIITFTGTADYTVDLSTLTASDIEFNEEEKVIVLRIPHAKQEEISIPEDRIQFGDTEHGLLSFGEIKLSPQQSAQIQAEARRKMQEKLDADNILETADRFAKLTVWELYSPIIKGVARDYSLEVEFR